MRVDEQFDERPGHPSRQLEGEKSPGPTAGQYSGQIVKTEANLLRLPLFALHTKRLKTLDGIECRGRITRDGQTQQFLFRATRNTATLYPGPLARSAHLAVLSIATEHGFPLANPITWTWRDLCRRMSVVYGGQIVLHLKDAMTATTGLLLYSESALYSKPDGKSLSTQQDALHLYDRVVFFGNQLPDGTTADRNCLWLSDWYLKNLNALFTAPLDYTLWRSLDEKSPIASRLYEFLLLNFYSGTPILRINYETLAQFLPIRPERYLSDAKRQLEGAFEALASSHILTGVTWTTAKNSLGQLHLYRGDRLTTTVDRDRTMLPFGDEDFANAIKVKELRNLRPPEWQLVTDFYRLWGGQENSRPTKKELAQAGDLVAQHGQAKAKALIPLLVTRLKEQWPEAKTFGAITRYLPDVIQAYDRQEYRAVRERQEQAREREEEQRRQTERQQLQERWQPVWDGLPEPEREDIRRRVLQKFPLLRKTPAMLDRKCLSELAQRHGTATPAGME